MEIHHIMILSGLLIEIAGAFVLAAEAIGPQRLSNWITKVRRVRMEMAGLQPRRRSTFLDPNRFICALGSAGGVGFACWLSGCLSASSFGAKVVAVATGGIAGAVFGVVLYKGALRSLLVAMHALARIEARVRFRAVGVLGFGLLFIGFLLQFIGTLAEGLRE